MCSRRLEESRKKMRFKFVFEPVHMIVPRLALTMTISNRKL